MPGVHDRGGWPTNEPIDQTDHQWMDWEFVTHALLGAVRSKGLMTGDEMRRGIEAIPEGVYEAYSYYERWSSSVETILTEKQVLTAGEIDEKVHELEERWGG